MSMDAKLFFPGSGWRSEKDFSNRRTQKNKRKVLKEANNNNNINVPAWIIKRKLFWNATCHDLEGKMKKKKSLFISISACVYERHVGINNRVESR